MLIKFLSKSPVNIGEYIITYTQNNEDFILKINKKISTSSIPITIGPLPIVGIDTNSIVPINKIPTDLISKINPVPTPIINPIIDNQNNLIPSYYTTSSNISYYYNSIESLSIMEGGGTVTVKYSDVKKLSEDYGIISFSINRYTKQYSLFSVTEETYITKENPAYYHDENNLIPLINFFTPYKNCNFSDCNIVIYSGPMQTESIDFDTSSIIFDQTIYSLSQYYRADNCWGPTSNYPFIIGSDISKVGIQTSFFVNVPNDVILYLKTNIGILSKTKITKSTDVILDLSLVSNFDEDAIIKVSSKYWTGLYRHTIKLIK